MIGDCYRRFNFRPDYTDIPDILCLNVCERLYESDPKRENAHALRPRILYTFALYLSPETQNI